MIHESALSSLPVLGWLISTSHLSVTGFFAWLAIRQARRWHHHHIAVAARRRRHQLSRTTTSMPKVQR